MKILCINNVISTENSSPSITEWANNSELEITIGKTYVVLAISKYIDVLFYYILSDESEDYPLAYPSHLFEIIDPNISKFWMTSLTQIQSINNLDIQNGEIISFKEWATKGDQFYENLLEGTNEEAKIFITYRDMMLNE
jgi:hypothetical protein